MLLPKTELLDKVIKELQSLALLYIILIIVLKIVFFRESLFFVIKVSASIFWMFILPGFTLMYVWHREINFLERLIICVPLSVVIVSVTSYYISLMGLHAKYHPILVPLFWIIAFSSVVFIKNKNKG